MTRSLHLSGPNGLERVVSYEPRRKAILLQVLRHQVSILTIEIPLGEFSYRCGMSGDAVEPARALWEALNLPGTKAELEWRRKRNVGSRRRYRRAVEARR